MAETPSTIQPGTPLEDNLARINDNFKAIDDENRTKIIRDGDTPRVLIGYQKDGFGTGSDYGIKVSQDGYDVTTATASQLAMSSQFNNFKIIGSGTLRVTKAASVAYAVNQVDLSTIPDFSDYAAVIAFTDYSHESIPSTYVMTSGAQSGKINMLMTYEIDASGDLFFELFCPDVGGLYATALDIGFKYFVLAETTT